jgi:hypothetical protein
MSQAIAGGGCGRFRHGAAKSKAKSTIRTPKAANFAAPVAVNAFFRERAQAARLGR